MIKTMLGEMCGTCKVEAHGKYHKSYLIEGECGRFWISEKEFRRIMLPNLKADEQKVCDEVMTDIIKLKQRSKNIYFSTDSETVKRHPYRVLEAAIKGGYNQC